MRLIYMDESGDSQDPKANYLAVASVMIPEHYCIAVERRLRKIQDGLRERGLKIPEQGCEFHASDIAHGRGHFRVLRKVERENLLEEITNLIHPYKMRVACLGASRQFDANSLRPALASSISTHGLKATLATMLLYMQNAVLGEYPRQYGLVIADRELFNPSIHGQITLDMRLLRSAPALLRKELKGLSALSRWKILDTVHPGDSASTCGIQIADAIAFGFRRKLDGKPDFTISLSARYKGVEVEPRELLPGLFLVMQ